RYQDDCDCQNPSSLDCHSILLSPEVLSIGALNTVSGLAQPRSTDRWFVSAIRECVFCHIPVGSGCHLVCCAMRDLTGTLPLERVPTPPTKMSDGKWHCQHRSIDRRPQRD